MAAAPRQRILDMLPLVVDGKPQGIGRSTRTLAKAIGWSEAATASMIYHMSRAKVIVSVGGNRRTGLLWGKVTPSYNDRRGLHENHTGGRPKGSRNASRRTGGSHA